MPYVTVPKDLTKVKTKVLFNLTKRQLICFSIGIAIGVPLYFGTKGALGNSTASLLMIVSMLPAFLFALYEKNGQHLEVIIHNMIQVMFLRPKKRPYQTNNFYAAVERQNQLDKETHIAHRQAAITQVEVIKRILTATQFRRLWMYCVDNLSVEEIAHIEGATPPAIYKSIRQSKKKIFVYFEKRV